jgi:hypothetical protein
MAIIMIASASSTLDSTAAQSYRSRIIQGAA